MRSKGSLADTSIGNNYQFKKKHCDSNKEQTVAFSIIDVAVRNKREGCVTLPGPREEEEKKSCFLNAD